MTPSDVEVTIQAVPRETTSDYVWRANKCGNDSSLLFATGIHIINFFIINIFQ